MLFLPVTFLVRTDRDGSNCCFRCVIDLDLGETLERVVIVVGIVEFIAKSR